MAEVKKAEDRTEEQPFEVLLEEYFSSMEKSVSEGEIVKGKIVKIGKREVVVDVGLKAEGVIPTSEFENVEDYSVGDEIEVFLEEIEGDDGMAVLSKHKADFMKVWDQIKGVYDNQEVVEGKVVKKVKGGLIVKVFGVDAFLPGSQVDIKPVRNMDEYIGRTLPLRILKLNLKRRNIVVSSRIIKEEERAKKKAEFFATVKQGDVVEGVVKNITDFGVFIDLGGVDGLLHITDMSWGRISHPSEMVKMGETLKLVVTNIDYEKERVSLGLKQLTPYPWDNVEEKYPVGSKVTAKVISLTEYRTFVEIEPGVEGVIHVSEMSWTQHVRRPSQLLAVGDTVEAVVKEIDKEAKKIILSLKEAQPDPWADVKEEFPVGKKVKGVVKNITGFGVFIELKEGIEGLLHVSDMSWTKKIGHPREMVKKGQEIETVILSVDVERKRISLGLKQLQEDPFEVFAREHSPGDYVEGKVMELLEKGIGVNLGEGLRGFVPFSHLARRGMKRPSDRYSMGETLKLKVLEITPEDRSIILSEREYIRDHESETEEEEE